MWIKLLTELLIIKKSILKLPDRKIILENSSGSFNNNGEIKSFIRSFNWSLRCLNIQPTITLVDFE